MRRAALIVLGLALLAGCRCDEPPSAPGDGAPRQAAVQAMPDPYAGLPPRGGVPPLERAAKVLANAGQALGYGDRAAQSLRAHAGESWAHRLVLFLDYGGTEQLNAGWLDLSDTTVDSPGVPMAVKARIRQAEARVLDLKADQPPVDDLRRRLVAEIAWTMVLLAPPAAADAGTPAPPPAKTPAGAK